MTSGFDLMHHTAFTLSVWTHTFAGFLMHHAWLCHSECYSFSYVVCVNIWESTRCAHTAGVIWALLPLDWCMKQLTWQIHNNSTINTLESAEKHTLTIRGHIVEWSHKPKRVKNLHTHTQKNLFWLTHWSSMQWTCTWERKNERQRRREREIKYWGQITERSKNKTKHGVISALKITDIVMTYKWGCSVKEKYMSKALSNSQTIFAINDRLAKLYDATTQKNG